MSENITINHILPKTRFLGHIFVADSQPFWRTSNWPPKLPNSRKMTQNNGHYAVQGHLGSLLSVWKKRHHVWIIVTCIHSCTISEMSRIISQIFAVDRGCLSSSKWQRELCMQWDAEDCTVRDNIDIMRVQGVCVCVCVWSAEHFMSQFFIVPYSLVPGHDAKTIRHISTEHCAQLCVYDETIVCRSFDYHVSTVLSFTCASVLLAVYSSAMC